MTISPRRSHLVFATRVRAWPFRVLRATGHGTVAAVLLGLAIAAPAAAQLERTPLNDVFVGGDRERYLRLLQLAGEAPVYPWSLRGLSAREVERLVPADSAHPWGRWPELQAGREQGPELSLVAPRTRMYYNSAFPFGSGDGPVWAGRGLTTAVQAGISFRYGPVSAVVAPIAFRAENAAFPLASSGKEELPFVDARSPTTVDLPQRFGEDAYQRVDLGESTLRLDVVGLALGISTASQQWGSAMRYPILVGNNAGGFPHVFLGTSRPINVGVGTVHVRAMWGDLDQSSYSPVTGHGSRRLMSGLVGVVTIAGLPGLELGASRFYHTPWPRSGLRGRHIVKPLEAFLKKNLPDGIKVGEDEKQDVDNQLASVFLRWIFPSSGVEVFGEFARDDHNWNARDLILEPDHMSAYSVGLAKVWKPTPERWWQLRAEVLNSSISHLAWVRNEVPFGSHGFTPQGHTLRGQFLASPAVYGGGGGVLGLDLYHPRGRWTVEWERIERGTSQSYFAERVTESRGSDVVHALGGEGLLVAGSWEISAGVTAARSFNRDLQSDATNLGVTLGVRRSISGWGTGR